MLSFMERFDGDHQDGFASQFGRQINDFFKKPLLTWETPTIPQEGEVSDFDY